MKPYDKSNSFMQRVTRRVSEFLPSRTWVNMLLGESQASSDLLSPSENDDQPPVKKLCTSTNTFTNVNNRTRVDSHSADNHRSSYVNVSLPEISAVTCIPSTSGQNSKFSNSSNSSSSHDTGIRSSLKRKSDTVDLSNISRPSQKSSAFNFASSTPAVVSVNKHPMVVTHSPRSLHSEKHCNSNDYLIQSSTIKLLKSRENESQPNLHLRDATAKHHAIPSFRWDTFVNYGELSERQKLFAQRSPLNCTQVMYGGRSASSNLSKILGHTPPIHKKTTIPISPTKTNEIRTTSSVLLDHISTKDKEIEENKFIIQPRVHSLHKANKKSVPVKVETTVNIIDATPEKTEEKSNNTSSSMYSGRDSSRKLRANISKKARGLQCDKLEMLDKVDLPNISLSVPVLPCISLSNNSNVISEDSEFTFNQPLTLEQFSSQIAEKSLRKKQNCESALKKTTIQNTNSNESNKDQHSSSTASSPSVNMFVNQATKKETGKLMTSNNDTKVVNSSSKDFAELMEFKDSPKTNFSSSIESFGPKLEPSKPTNTIFGNSSQVFKATDENQQQSDKLSVELKKWSCDTCWVVNDSDKIHCVACQTPKPNNSQKPGNSQKPLIVTKSIKKVDQHSDWTCDGCWVKNKHESNSCISCGTVKPGSGPDNKPQLSTQFNFGLNNNSFENQIKFGFDSQTDQSNPQFKFGNLVTIKNPEDSKTDSPNTKFKFGSVDTKSEQQFGTFKFGFDSATKEPEKKLNADQPIYKFGFENKIDQPKEQFKFEKKADQPEDQFKLNLEKKADQPEGQFKFDLNKTTDQPKGQLNFGFNSTKNVPVTKFKFGSDPVETEKSVKPNCITDSSKISAISANESLNVVNNKNEMSVKSDATLSTGGPSRFGDSNLFKKSIPLFTFGSAKTNCSDANIVFSNGNKNDDVAKEKCILDKKDNIEMKSINCVMTQTNQPSVGSTNTNQMVNGHSHPNDDQKPGFIKASQLFGFGSLAKQDQSLPDDPKNHNTFTFGSVSNDNKSFVTPLATSSFPNNTPLFGSSNSVFGNGPTSTSVSMGSPVQTPKFSFGSMAPTGDNFFSKTTSFDKPSTQNSFASTTKVSFSFDSQSQPVFSAANSAGLFTKAVQANDQEKSVSNNLFSQSNTKPSVKLDPNAPISINFTGGATTQFTAKPETTEPPAKRKILKPVRRIR